MFASHLCKNSQAITDPNFNNVSLLLHGDGTNGAQNNTFLDSSTNNFAITRSGTPSQGSFSPFALNGVAYSPTVHGGSGYFNGNGNYIYVSNNTFDVSAGNSVFTFECWVYPIISTGGCVVSIGNLGAYSNQFLLYYGLTSGKFTFQRDDGSSGTPIFSITSSGTFSISNWHHVAISKTSAGLHTLYINGVNNGSATSTGPFAGGGTTYFVFNGAADSGGIGNSGSTYYFSNLRFTKGAALYTSNFTPPTSPVTLLSNGGATPSTAPTTGQVSLLCNFTNGGIFDNTKNNVLTTVGNSQVSTSVVKYGTGAMYFDGTGDYLTMPSSNNFAFGTGNFTVEAWIYLQGTTGHKTIFSTRSGAIVDAAAFTIGLYPTTNTLYYFSDNYYFNLNSIALNTWTYIAFTKSGTSLRMFINGTLLSTISNSQNITSVLGTVGANANGIEPFIGAIDELRITKGIARYTASFTPPTQAFPNL